LRPGVEFPRAPLTIHNSQLTTFLNDHLPPADRQRLSLGSIYALIALGYTMVYGVLRLINFAHGERVHVAPTSALPLTQAARGPAVVVSALLVMLGAMVACAILGLIIERLAYRPVRRASRLTLLITAIGVSPSSRTRQLVFGPDPKFFPSLAPPLRLHRRRRAADERADHGHRGVVSPDILLRFFILKTDARRCARSRSTWTRRS